MAQAKQPDNHLITPKQAQEQLKQARSSAKEAMNEGELNQRKANFVGAKSLVTSALRGLKDLPVAQKKTQGALLNTLRSDLEAIFADRKSELMNKTEYGAVDLSQPQPGATYGHLHPTSHILTEAYSIFERLGFTIVDGPEVETDWYNFEALNMPPEHPAREMQDTFYLKENQAGRPLIPRTHTSGMQVRFLEQNKPPIKIIVPGKVFRNENEDATHSWIFTQVEGLVVGEGVSLSDLKGTLAHFVQGILGPDSTIRLRPSYFPYTEPSVEVDARFRGQWLELLGAGMVHPKVLESAGVDSSKYSGFAFGVGVERLAQIKFGMDDLRQNWRPNLRFLEAF